MVQLKPEPHTITDKRSHDLLFALLSSTYDVHTQFAFDEMLRLWFCSQEPCLAAFLKWLDGRGLEIRKKQ